MSASNILLLLVTLIHFFNSSLEARDGDTLAVNKPLRSNDTLVSSGGIFELGFFTPGSSLKEYVGVWYLLNKKIFVWVANRELPVVKTPGKLTLLKNGVLKISDNDNVTIWSSSSNKSMLNPMAKLLDSGNFVVMDKNQKPSDHFAWEGFQYACDTRLPRMKIGYNLREKRNVYLSSWKSLDDPAEGEYTFKLDILGIPQYFYRKGSREIVRLGPWNGETFSGSPKPGLFYKFSYTSDDKWIYFSLEPKITRPVLSRTVLGVNGDLLYFVGIDYSIILTTSPFILTVMDNCAGYNRCGPYASCDTKKSPECECLTGYVPKSQNVWDKANWTNGCIRRISSNFTRDDKFSTLSSVKVPDTRNAYGNLSWSLEKCRKACLENCLCTAYGNMYVIDNGKGCLHWFGELKDIKVVDAESGQDIFIRAAYQNKGVKSAFLHLFLNQLLIKVIIICTIVSSLVLLITMITIKYLRTKKTNRLQRNGIMDEISVNDEELDSPIFDMKTISKATDNFSIENKLGEGGFGPVYKGLLEGGQEIAVKKLSRDSTQGSEEFKNEVMCIAKLQHRNLVKLLGCCNQEEYMLIYEFMPNKSLDLHIFENISSTILDWSERWSIIKGVARGLLYLHQDSRLIIIHRDLKASNILLDSEMNPKISDFGMARICGSSETTENTNRVVGTYGYMSPEYALEGLFSVKSDVFSFGVLILEIISGKRCRGFCHDEHHLSLLGHTWELFNQERFTEVVDQTLKDSYDPAEVIKAIHIGLLCVQQSPNDRPTMASVVLMLSGEGDLSPPKAPGFYTTMELLEPDTSSNNQHFTTSPAQA